MKYVESMGTNLKLGTWGQVGMMHLNGIYIKGSCIGTVASWPKQKKIASKWRHEWAAK